MSNKIGFWSVFSIVIGSQIGSSVFTAPINLAPYGFYGIIGYLIASFGAIALCFVFSYLCSHFPKTGGPHVYIKHTLGDNWAFFAGWTYWVVSWISTTVVIIAIIGYIDPFLKLLPYENMQVSYVCLELLILGIVVILNLEGVRFAGIIGVILGIIKIVPLIILPLVALTHFDAQNFIVQSESLDLPTSEILSKVSLVALWGFIGLETGTAPAESVRNPARTIPKAIILGTLFTSLLYILNILAIMGMIPGAELSTSTAPYVDVARILFGGNWSLLIAALSAIICLGTLNSWILTSSQIALGLAQDGFFPAFISSKNKNCAPQIAIIMSSIGIAPLLFLTANDDFATQIKDLINFSVSIFLFVYLLCIIGFLKHQLSSGVNIALFVIGLFATIFCLWIIISWIIYDTTILRLIALSMFTLSGLPLYIFWYKKKC